MKILYFSDHGPYSSTFIRQDVEEMSHRHETLYIAAISDEEYESKNIQSEIIHYPAHSLRSKLLWKLENAEIRSNWFNREFHEKLKVRIDSFNPDIIHCQFAYEGLKLWDNYKTDKPVFINFRGYDASYKLQNKSYVRHLKKILSQSNVYPIFVCEALKNNLLAKGITLNKKNLVLYTGVNTSNFIRTNYQKKKNPVFIQTGAFNAKKGQYITLKAFNEFLKVKPESGAKLVFIGEGEFLEQVKNASVKFGISDKVEFKGKLPQNQIVELLNDATVFVHHSITAPNGDQEGIPNAVVEAMSMEMPILSTYHSGIPELVENNVNGLLCKENDVNELTKQMIEIISWSYLPVNREKVEKMFNFQKHIAVLDEFYQSIFIS